VFWVEVVKGGLDHFTRMLWPVEGLMKRPRAREQAWERFVEEGLSVDQI
jgi:hypothetical protein